MDVVLPFLSLFTCEKENDITVEKNIESVSRSRFPCKGTIGLVITMTGGITLKRVITFFVGFRDIFFFKNSAASL